MTKSENEIKNLSQTDSQKKSSQTKSQRKSVQKDTSINADTASQEKKKVMKLKKSDEEKNVSDNNKDTNIDVTKVKQKKSSQSDNKEQKKVKVDDLKKTVEPVQETKVDDVKNKSKNTSQTDLKQSAEKNLKKTILESEKPVMSKKSKKNSSIVNNEDIVNKENKNVINGSSQREDTSQLIINFFTNIQNDLRAIREHLVPDDNVKKAKKNNYNDQLIKKQEVTETKKEMTDDKKMENNKTAKKDTAKEAKKEIAKDIKKEISKETKKEAVKEIKSKKSEGNTSAIIYDDDFYLSKIKAKYLPNQEFTANDTRNIWITSVGRLPAVKWNDILINLSNKNKIMFVNEVNDKRRYKLGH